MGAMGRKRQSNHDLPPRMHPPKTSGGPYYYVTSTTPRKWIPLDPDLPRARLMWAQIENGEGGDGGLFTARLDAYLVSTKYLDLAAKTRQQYENVAKTLREYFKGATVGAITPAHVALWMDKHHSKIQANTGKAIVSNVFDIAVRHGLVNTNPAKLIPYHNIKGRDRLITDGEYRAIWNLAEPHVQIAMDIGYLTGTRIQDILDIKLQDVTAEGIYIKQGKTKRRMLFLASAALDEVVGRARALPRPIRGMHLLCNRYGAAYGYRTFNDHWLDAVRAAGVEGVHFHDIRAKAATDAKAMGMDYQSLLGHTTKAMSDKYIRDRETTRVNGLPRLSAG